MISFKQELEYYVKQLMPINHAIVRFTNWGRK